MRLAKIKTSHYVSQTLDTLGASFFGDVNCRRVHHAVGQLTAIHEAILMMACDLVACDLTSV